jgi:hypothetical protein
MSARYWDSLASAALDTARRFLRLSAVRLSLRCPFDRILPRPASIRVPARLYW